MKKATKAVPGRLGPRIAVDHAGTGPGASKGRRLNEKGDLQIEYHGPTESRQPGERLDSYSGSGGRSETKREARTSVRGEGEPSTGIVALKA